MNQCSQSPVISSSSFTRFFGPLQLAHATISDCRKAIAEHVLGDGLGAALPSATLVELRVIVGRLDKIESRIAGQIAERN